MKRKLSFIEQFDRTLSGGFLKQITWLTIFTLMILAVLVGISLLFPEGDQIFGMGGRLERIKGLFYHLIDPGNLSLESHNIIGIQVFTGIVAALGMVLLSGMLITTLTNVVERTRIEKYDGGIHYTDDGENWVDVAFDTPVSMNIWGFHPDLLADMQTYFEDFLRALKPEEIKAECLLPIMVNEFLQKKKISVLSKPSPDRWFGITYKADREAVENELAKLHGLGVYPDSLYGC